MQLGVILDMMYIGTFLKTELNLILTTLIQLTLHQGGTAGSIRELQKLFILAAELSSPYNNTVFRLG